MLVSVNLTTGYSDGQISFKIPLKFSNRNLTQEERVQYRDLMIDDVQYEKMVIIPSNTVYLGKYDTIAGRFVDTTAEDFLKQFIKVALIKGHYAKNKDYEMRML